MDALKLEDFLEEDSIVKTKLEKGSEWIANVVSKIRLDTSEIVLPFDERYLIIFAMVGDKLQVTQTKDGYEYLIDTIITQVMIEPERCMVLRVKGVSRVENKRKDERYSVNYAVTIQSFSEFEGVFGVVTNISVSGLAFVCRKDFMHGEMIHLSIMLPSSVFSIDAEIVRITETPKGMEYGVKFIRNDPEAIRDIEALIADIVEREDRLSRIVGFNM